MIEEELSNKYVISHLKKIIKAIENEDIIIKSLLMNEDGYGFETISAIYQVPSIIPKTKGAWIDIKISNNIRL